jgi:hypothetical protein
MAAGQRDLDAHIGWCSSSLWLATIATAMPHFLATSCTIQHTTHGGVARGLNAALALLL